MTLQRSACPGLSGDGGGNNESRDVKEETARNEEQKEVQEKTQEKESTDKDWGKDGGGEMWDEG